MWRCKHCKLVFQQLRKYRAHMKRHDDCHKCDKCGATLDTKEALLAHEDLHTRTVGTQTYDTCIPDIKRSRACRVSDRYERRGRQPEDTSRSPLRSSTSSSSSRFSFKPPSSLPSRSSISSSSVKPSFSSRPVTSSSSSFPLSSRPSTSGSAATSRGSAPESVKDTSDDEFDAACKLAEAGISII